MVVVIKRTGHCRRLKTKNEWNTPSYNGLVLFRESQVRLPGVVAIRIPFQSKRHFQKNWFTGHLQTARWYNWPSIIRIINVNSHINHHLPFSSDDHLRRMSRGRVRKTDRGSVILWQVEIFVANVTFLSWIPITKNTWHLQINGSLTCFLLWFCNCLHCS